MSGTIFTSKTNKQSVFFPANGRYEMFFQLEESDKYTLNNFKKSGFYWTGTIEDEYKAYHLVFDSKGASVKTIDRKSNIYNYFYRLGVRPVTD